MNTIKRYYCTFLFLFFLVSCDRMPASLPDANVCVFLPGECLANTELTFCKPGSDWQQHQNNRFLFAFKLDLSNHILEKTDNRVMALNWRDIPSENLFDNFGNNGKAVKNLFEETYANFNTAFESYFHSRNYSIVTILYNGGISLIANEEFAGVPAGENLAHLITCIPSYDTMVEESGENPIIAPGTNVPEYSGKFLNITEDFVCILSDVISFSIPFQNYKLTNEALTFDLKIPVKVVNYLNWLNNRITMPDADIQYADEVLHCKFISLHGLK